jgi:hypothetical protein
MQYHHHQKACLPKDTGSGSVQQKGSDNLLFYIVLDEFMSDLLEKGFGIGSVCRLKRRASKKITYNSAAFCVDSDYSLVLIITWRCVRLKEGHYLRRLREKFLGRFCFCSSYYLRGDQLYLI